MTPHLLVYRTLIQSPQKRRPFQLKRSTRWKNGTNAKVANLQHVLHSGLLFRAFFFVLPQELYCRNRPKSLLLPVQLWLYVRHTSPHRSGGALLSVPLATSPLSLLQEDSVMLSQSAIDRGLCPVRNWEDEMPPRLHKESPTKLTFECAFFL